VASIRLDAATVFLVSLTIYCLLGQEKNYGDGNFLLGFYHEGARVHPVHILYFPVLSLLQAVCSPLGLSLFQVAAFYSALGTSIGLACCHLAISALGFSRREAVLSSAALALCPAIIFFATVVELHGPFFAFVGLSFYLLARLMRSPGMGTALLLGMSSAGSYYAHASGYILVGLLVLCILGLSPRAECCRGRQLLLVGIVVAAHLGLIHGGALLLQSFGLVLGVEEASGYMSSLEVLGDADWTWGLRTLWEEWLWAFMPLSIVSLAAVVTEPGRRFTLALLPAILVYLFSALLLVGDHDERGAYLIPLSVSALLGALLARSCQRGKLLALCIVLGGVIGITRVALHDDGSKSLAEAAEFSEQTAGQPAYLLTGTESDIETCMLRLPGQPYRHLARYAGLLPSELEAQLPVLDRAIDGLLSAGTRIYLTRGAVLALETEGETNRSGVAFLAHLRSRYSLSELPAGSFLAYRLERRPN
jgi:hypothetical protein